MIRVVSFFIYFVTLFAVTFANYSAAYSAGPCSAMKLIKEDQWNAALKCAKSQHHSLLVKIVLWSKYKDRKSDAKTEEILKFVSQNSNFPDTWTLKSIAEEKINEKTDTKFLKQWFLTHLPVTDDGIKAYLELIGSRLKEKDRKMWVQKAWIRVDYNKDERKAFLVKYKKYLTHSDHIKKLDHMLWEGHRRLDSDLLLLVDRDFRALFAARLQILRNHSNMSQILSTVPKNLRAAPGLLYARAMWYKKRGHYSKLAKLILDHPHISTLKKDRWFKLRARTALELAQKGHYRTSYRVSSEHNYYNAVNYVDGEWFAGKVAWVYRDDAKTALGHFKKILKKSKYSISRSKSSYWSGMMYQKLGMKSESKKYFDIAAEYPDTFYGQLGIMKVRNNQDSHIVDKPPIVTKEDEYWIKNNELVRASILFASSKQHNYARRFAGAAFNKADTVGKKYLLTRIGIDKKIYSLSVLYNKIAESRGIFFVSHSYPVLKLKSFNKNIEKALALAIIRQESEFDTYALSPAGAMGLMQLMYKTAKQMGHEVHTKITKEALYNSPELNVKLGSYYISKLVDRYDGSYILAIASYNAGPNNVDRWIKAYGDPRGLDDVDEVVEWIEKIPYYETRAYVQHVLSNLQIYRNILDAQKKNKPVQSIKIDLKKDLVIKE